ncbi:MAG: pilin [Candidatus Gracilibacteria bacterium]|nr:pilin [Candidatus Gracilibacteria bacterium]
MKKLLKKIAVSLVLCALSFVILSFGFIAFANASSPPAGNSDSITTSILPVAEDNADCKDTYNPDVKGRESIVGTLNGSDQKAINNVLGCGIKTGNIKLYMVPYYVRAVLEFVIGISGLICVGAIIFGGYWYLFAGVSEDKEKGKKAILYGLVGMVLTLVAWAFVNIIIGLLTM